MNKIINSIDLTKIYGEKETSITALDKINVEFKENELQQSWVHLALESQPYFIV